MFSGTRVERDFVEAPSQMLENWCWQPEALARMSRHHATGAPIPDALQAAMINTRNANAGILNLTLSVPDPDADPDQPCP